ncbi:MAG: TonB-dependent receptor [Gemmatimonadaceae bacterium]|nr:TonB-dependent receptor [Gemmatimonadaceae bacterium]
MSRAVLASRLALTAALAIASIPLQAQSVTVRGRVTAVATGEPLPAAIVRLVDLHREVRTHEDGSFSFGLVAPGRYQVTVQRIGYESLTRELIVSAGMDSVSLAMRASPLQLAATVVTGQVAERGAADAISSSNVLSDAKLDVRLDGTLGSTVAGTPGVSMVSMGPATARPVVRGLGGDRVLILEDGMRSGDLSNSSNDHAVAIDPVTAQKVEVVRGPMSLLYGSSALGGVVNVIRQEIPTVRFEHRHGALSTQASSVNDGASIGAFAEFPLAGFSVRTEGSLRRSGDLRTPIGRLENTQVGASGASIGVSKVNGWGHTGLSYRYFANDYGLPGGFVGAHDGGVDIAMQRHMLRSETEWHPVDGAFENVRLNLSFSDYRHQELAKSGAVGTRFQQLMTVGELVARHSGIAGGAGGAIGLRAQYRDITPSGPIRATPTVDWTLAAFAIEEFGTGPLRAQAGLRYDFARFIPLVRREIVVGSDTLPTLPRDFGAVSASVGALYALENGVRVGASLSRSYRTPDFNELYSDGPHLAAYSYDVGDPRNDQETGYGVDVFARIERQRVRGEVAAFANRLQGYLFPRNTGEPGRQAQRWKFQYTNEDATLVGAEGDIEITLREHVVLEATASYVRGVIAGDRDTIPGIGGAPDVVESAYLPLMPPLNGRVGLRHETPRWSFGGHVRWAARQTLLGDFETETPGYATLNLHAGWRFVSGDRLHAFTLRLDNLLDTEVREHLSRTKDIIPDAGRNVTLLYRVQF